MPIIKSAKKALRSSTRKHEANLEFKEKLRDSIKKANSKTINKAYSVIDKAAKKNLIHKNKAARLKSALIKKIGETPKADKKSVPVAKKSIKSKTKKSSK
jgi:small subunit ribosomal protein S20